LSEKSPHICVDFLTLSLMNIILFDSNLENDYSLHYTHPISDFKIEILIIQEKWANNYQNRNL